MPAPDGELSLLCPECGHDARMTRDAQHPRCQECGFRFSKRDLLAHRAPDLAGAPTSLSPHERRFSGPAVIVASLTLLIVISVAIVMFILANR
ncbi:MAG: hypothetical protein HKO59_00135 [Phycisphaerales bacterium]|nr:hypothetical protein [Phycisphaerae bacterium]NNF44815.1 hypothetical protein [Phycisphaerales bacterium]NNM24390.1 hypothetical protein [Phycisphaerales bacterium]